jgi:squalene synthase HpnC
VPAVNSAGSAAAPPLAAPSQAETMAKAREENFPVAAVFLGRRRRRLLIAIYGFARLVDDIGDEAPGDRAALLDWAERELDRASAGEQPRHAATRALAAAMREGGLPAEPFRRLIEANRRDQQVSRYETFDELLDYCRLSAAPVGELVLHVFGAATPERIDLSERICAGLQVAEHIQDVVEDRERGRVYLPAADLRRFGCTADDLAARAATPALRELIGFEVRRARGLLVEGTPLIRRLRGSAALAVTGYVAGGRAALDAVEAAGCDVFAARPRPNRRRFAAAFLRTAVAR